MSAKLKAVKIARFLTSGLVVRKRLPVEFGGARINITPRSDIRLLAPGLGLSASDLLQVAAAYIKPGYCVWDIGSNLGIFSFCSAWKAGSEGKVFTLEANSRYVEFQHDSRSKLPGGYAPVSPLCAAISDSIGLLELAVSKQGHARSHLTILGDGGAVSEAKNQVVSLTADFLLQHWSKPDFVKVDVEGAELLFLRGATKLFETARPLLYIETYPASRDAATRILSSFGYRLFSISDDGREIPEERCTFNTLAKPVEKC